MPRKRTDRAAPRDTKRAAEKPRAAILGLGLIGGSIALALRERGWHVSGYDTAAARRPQRFRALVHELAGSPAAALAGARIVILASPLPQIVETLRRFPDGALRGAIVTDVASVKAPVMRAARMLPAGLSFVGGHPLAGRETGGPEQADAQLFVGARWVLTLAPGSPPSARRAIEQLVKSLGARPVHLHPSEHDRVLALTSHLPQIVSWLLGAAISHEIAPREAAQLSGSGLQSMLRLARSSPGLWKPVITSNLEEVTRALEHFERELTGLRAALARPGSVGSIAKRSAELASRVGGKAMPSAQDSKNKKTP